MMKDPNDRDEIEGTTSKRQGSAVAQDECGRSRSLFLRQAETLQRTVEPDNKRTWTFRQDSCVFAIAATDIEHANAFLTGTHADSFEKP
jgi:hypothetical protein